MFVFPAGVVRFVSRFVALIRSAQTVPPERGSDSNIKSPFYNLSQIVFLSIPLSRAEVPIREIKWRVLVVQSHTSLLDNLLKMEVFGLESVFVFRPH